MTESANLIILNSIAVWLIEMAKKSKFMPFITAETQKVNHIASAVLAAFAAAGVVFTVAHTGTVSTGTLTISWAGLTVSNMVSFGYHWIGYYASQKWMYKSAFAKETA